VGRKWWVSWFKKSRLGGRLGSFAVCGSEMKNPARGRASHRTRERNAYVASFFDYSSPRPHLRGGRCAKSRQLRLVVGRPGSGPDAKLSRYTRKILDSNHTCQPTKIRQTHLRRGRCANSLRIRRVVDGEGNHPVAPSRFGAWRCSPLCAGLRSTQ
jgi:hypothetical protein